MMNATDIITHMCSLQDPEQRSHIMRYFKTAPGQYGAGDRFLGIRVPQTREIAKKAVKLPLNQITTLLTNEYHEVRLCGFLILVGRFQRYSRPKLVNSINAITSRDIIVETYLRYARYANNWDLVDLSAPKILGAWLMLPTSLGDDDSEPDDRHDYKIATLDSLADSYNLWLQRISIVATQTPTMHGDPTYTFRYAKRHLYHTHDLIQKAVGWMLREVGKRISADHLRDFLHQNATKMSRTTLRYAIEHFSKEERQFWLTMKNA